MVKYKETEMYAKCHKTQQTKPSSLNKNMFLTCFSPRSSLNTFANGLRMYKIIPEYQKLFEFDAI